MMSLENVNVVQDNDCHWYWILDSDLKEFNTMINLLDDKEYLDCPELFDMFVDKYSKFQTGGSPDNEPEYFKDYFNDTDR